MESAHLSEEEYRTAVLDAVMKLPARGSKRGGVRWLGVTEDENGTVVTWGVGCVLYGRPGEEDAEVYVIVTQTVEGLGVDAVCDTPTEAAQILLDSEGIQFRPGLLQTGKNV